MLINTNELQARKMISLVERYHVSEIETEIDGHCDTPVSHAVFYLAGETAIPAKRSAETAICILLYLSTYFVNKLLLTRRARDVRMRNY